MTNVHNPSIFTRVYSIIVIMHKIVLKQLTYKCVWRRGGRNQWLNVWMTTVITVINNNSKKWIKTQKKTLKQMQTFEWRNCFSLQNPAGVHSGHLANENYLHILLVYGFPGLERALNINI